MDDRSDTTNDSTTSSNKMVWARARRRDAIRRRKDVFVDEHDPESMLSAMSTHTSEHAHPWLGDWSTPEDLALRPMKLPTQGRRGGASSGTPRPSRAASLESLRQEFAALRKDVHTLQEGLAELHASVEQIRGQGNVLEDYRRRLIADYPQAAAVYHWEHEGTTYFFTLLNTERREDEYAIYELQSELRSAHQAENFIFDRTTTVQRLNEAEVEIDDFLGPRAKVLFLRQG